MWREDGSSLEMLNIGDARKTAAKKHRESETDRRIVNGENNTGCNSATDAGITGTEFVTGCCDKEAQPNALSLPTSLRLQIFSWATTLWATPVHTLYWPKLNSHFSFTEMLLIVGFYSWNVVKTIWNFHENHHCLLLLHKIETVLVIYKQNFKIF